jgi:hypothetical protein
MANRISTEVIAARIFEIRGKRIMLDRDLAWLYGVATKVLNQAVRRNKERFPGDFLFQLTKAERNELVTNCDQFKTLKHSTVLPYVFTQEGVAMLSSVLRSKRAVQVNIAIMRVFVKLRKAFSVHKELAYKLKELENRVENHDADIKDIFEAIRQLMRLPDEHKRIVGFVAKEK